MGSDDSGAAAGAAGGSVPSEAEQRASWNAWNASTREKRLSEISVDQRTVVEAWLSNIGRTDLNIIEVGCGSGWLCPTLERFGSVTATDIADEVLKRAQARMPAVKFVAGDFTALDFGREAFDVVVSMEVLSHVADQTAFLNKLADMLKPNGVLMLGTQNRIALEKYNNVPPVIPGVLRKWVDERQLRDLLRPRFDVFEVRGITPKTDKMPWRLVNNPKINPLLDTLSGGAIKRMKERAGWGWTLMALARRRDT